MSDVLNFKLSLTGAEGVAGGMENVGKAFAMSAADAQRYERAAAAAATAQVALDKAAAKSTAAQSAYSAAVKGAVASDEELVRLAQAAASAVAAQGVALDSLKGKSAALKSLAAEHQNLGAQAKLSGYQTAQMSAQLQDFFVQLQAGGSPLTAAIQQGSQLSAVFGGFRPALAAMASILSPTVLLLGGLGAAAAAVGAAWFAGNRESAAFRQSLALTNNAAGVTADGVQAMAKNIGEKTSAGVGVAKEALYELIAGGKVSSTALESTATAAAALSRATGEAAGDIAKRFAGMSDDVIGNATKLNQQFHFLTAEQLASIRTTEEHGNAMSALSTVMDALGSHVNKSVEQIGSIERAWMNARVEMANFKDMWLAIGRDTTTGDQLAKIRAQIAELDRAGQKSYVFGPSRAELAAQAEQLQILVDGEKTLARLDGESAQRQQAKTKWDTDAQKSLNHKDAWTKQVEAIQGAAGAAGLSLDSKAVTDQIEAVRQKSAIFADSQAAAIAHVSAASAIAAARSSSTLQLLQQQYESGQLRLVEYTQLSGNATVASLRAEAAAIAKSLSIARAKRDNLAEVIGLEGQAAAKRIEIANAVGKVEFDVAQASAKAFKDQAAAMVSAYDSTYAEASKATVAAGDQVRALEAEALAAAMSRSGYMSMAEAVERVTIAQLNQKIAAEQARVAAGGDNAVLGALQKELEYRERIAQLIGNKDAAARDAKALEEANKTLDAFFAPDRAKTFAEVIGEAFNKAGGAVGKMGQALQTYGAQMANIQKAQAAASQLDNPVQKWIAEQEIAKKSASTQIGLYADMAGAAKGFFAEGSRGYKTLQAAEMAFRAYQLASDLVAGASAAAVAIATQAKGDPYTAWPRMAAMAAAMAALGFAVSGGFNSGGSAPSAADRQAATGTGTVFGDSTAKSDSIAKTIEALSGTAKIELTVQSGMLASLRNIEASMAGLGNLVLQTTGLTTGKNLGIQTGKISVNKGDPVLNALGIRNPNAETAGAIVGSWFGPVGTVVGAAVGKAVGKVADKLQALWGGVSQSISDAGLSINGKVSDLSGGSGVQQYADVATTKKSFFGLVKNTTNSTQFAALGDDMSKQFGMVFAGIGDALQSAAVALGRDGQTVGQAVADFVVDIPRLSLKDLKGADLQAAIGNAISGASDGIAKAAIAGLDGFQQVGEGYFQTLVRVASGVESARVALDAVGVATVGYTAVINKQGDVATEIVRQSITAAESAGGVLSSVGQMIDQFNGSAADLVTTYTALRDVRVTLVAMGVEASALTTAMIQGAGGLDALKSSVSSYLSDFYTDAERFNIGVQQIGAELGRLGITTVPASKAAFRALVEAQDLTTAAGQRTYGALVALSGQFSAVIGGINSLSDALSGLVGGLQDEAKTRLDALASAINAQKTALTTAYNARISALDAQGQAAKDVYQAISEQVGKDKDAAKLAYDALDKTLSDAVKAFTDTVGKLKDLNTSLTNTLRQMRPIGSEGADRASAQAQIAQALAVAKATGVLPTAADLQDALSVIAKPSEALFADANDYLRDFYRTQINLQDLQGITVAQQATAQAQLDAATNQLTGAKSAYDSTVAKGDAKLSIAGATRDATLATVGAGKEAAKGAYDNATGALDSQLAMATAQYNQLAGINTGVQDLGGLFKSLGAALASWAAASGKTAPAGVAAIKTGEWVTTGKVQTWADAAGATAVQATGNTSGAGAIVTAKDKKTTFTVADIVTFVNARLAEDNPRAIYDAAIMYGISSSSLDAAMGWASGTSLKWATDNGLPAFAAGGLHAGGLALVGERGPEIVATGPARVWNNAQTMAMLQDPQRGNDVLAAEIKALRAEVSQLRSENNAGHLANATNTNKTARILDRWDGDGQPDVRPLT